jgi:hypothetical protein
MEEKKVKKNDFWEYIIGLIIIIGFIWILVANEGGRHGDCWKDAWGSIECHEDPRG